MLSDLELLAIAIRFVISDDRLNPVMVERRSRLSDVPSWAVTRGGSCLAKDGQWEIEPLPSSRDDAFRQRCRWSDLGEAITAAKAATAPQD